MHCWRVRLVAPITVGLVVGKSSSQKARLVLHSHLAAQYRSIRIKGLKVRIFQDSLLGPRLMWLHLVVSSCLSLQEAIVQSIDHYIQWGYWCKCWYGKRCFREIPKPKSDRWFRTQPNTQCHLYQLIPTIHMFGRIEKRWCFCLLNDPDMLWGVADQVRVGAATNAVRIAQKWIELEE